MTAALFWTITLLVIATAHFAAGCYFYKQAQCRFRVALDLHDGTKKLLKDCEKTRNDSFQYMETGRAYWMMAQIVSEGESEEWKDS